MRRELPDVFAATAARYPALAHFIPELGEDGAAVDRAGLFRAVTGAFCTIARYRALALVLDDMQWADRASLELIGEMAQESAARRRSSFSFIATTVSRADIPFACCARRCGERGS